MKYTIESAMRKVRNGYGIAAWGAVDFLRANGHPGLMPRKIDIGPLPGAPAKSEYSTVVIRPNNMRCIKFAH